LVLLLSICFDMNGLGSMEGMLRFCGMGFGMHCDGDGDGVSGLDGRRQLALEELRNYGECIERGKARSPFEIFSTLFVVFVTLVYFLFSGMGYLRRTQ
jgi:hypothetical protein